MTQEETFEAAKRQVDRAQHVLLLTDERSDGDTFGSSLAFREYLQQLGKRVTHLAGSPIGESLQFLPGIETVVEDRALLADPSIDLVIAFDSSRQAFVEAFCAQLPRRAPLVLFDHHNSNTRFGDVNVVHPSFSSTCEVVYAYLVHHQVSISRSMAMCLMTGVLTDTRMLSNPVTNAQAIGAAAELLVHGGSIKSVLRHVFKQMRLEQLQLWGRIFDRGVFVPERNIAIFWVTPEDHVQTDTSEEESAEVIDYLQATLAVDTVFFLKGRADGTVRVSMRARGKNIANLATFFGGGGHPGACAFTVSGALQMQDGRVCIV